MDREIRRGGRRPAARDPRALHSAPPAIEPLGRTPHGRATAPRPTIEPVARPVPADAWPAWTDLVVWSAPLDETEGGADVR
ncbi:hypothetical protein [Paludisphaera sp.]|uniref:hypothetical protein n=1 Tax=Paludisphaera sp. TaxID=2017432 RepID=UPI00301CE5D6